ncbi:MAG: TIGR04552 family protein [Alphaproteobacteria bacterium]|nr:TIGR04552 family protein [Alphaproteobacteria bacterium]
MRRDMLEIDAGWQNSTWIHALDLHDVEAMRLMLSGGSVIDWQRLALVDFEHVDAYLSLHCLDMGNPAHADRLRYVFNEAVSYLEEHLKLHFPSELRNPDDVREVFVWASQFGGFRRTQILSCVVLKLMHVIQHLAAADLRHRTPISEAEVLALAHRRIINSAHAMQEDGVPVLSFTGNRKSRSSVITKLLAKKENVAATVFDKLRYRCIVERPEHCADALAWMGRNMFPFNYVIPGQSHNNLLDPATLLEELTDAEREHAQDLREEPELAEATKNEFSGASYRMINFIVDYPVPLPETRHSFDIEVGHVVFVNVEFQVIDEETARNNERGENAHHLYKARQQQVVAQRLKRGGRLR